MKSKLYVRVLSLVVCVIMLAGSIQMVSFANTDNCAHSSAVWGVYQQPSESESGVLCRQCHECGDTLEYKNIDKYAMPFYDVPATRWSNPYITLLYAAGMVNGTHPTLFSPADNVTRAQFLKMLYGLSGDELGDGTTSFTDVKASAWYAPYVEWGVDNGIVNGVGGNKFSPDGNITRQDMAVMLNRFISYLDGYTPDYVNPAIIFSDSSVIADYAIDAVTAMQRSNIIGGIANEDGTYRFEPKSNATREQAAKMIGELFCSYYGIELPEAVESPEIVTYNITYNLNGGTISGVVRKTYDITTETFTVPKPTKKGYEFLGWSVYGKTGYHKNYTVKKGTTGWIGLTANWKAISYSITYTNIANATMPYKRTSYTIADTFTLPQPTRTGYIFNGWTGTGLSSATKSVTVKVGSTGNRSYKANWVYQTYKISYTLNGGTISASAKKSYNIDTPTFTIPTPTRNGYVFTGWSVYGKSGTYMTYTVSKGTVGWIGLTANWRKETTQEKAFKGMKNAILNYYDDTGSDGTKAIIYLADYDSEYYDRAVAFMYTPGSDTIDVMMYRTDDLSHKRTVILSLTATDSSFDYIYFDYWDWTYSDDDTNLYAMGYVTGSSFSFDPLFGDDYGYSSNEQQHEDNAEEYLIDIYDAIDQFFADYVSGSYGADSFGLRYN